MGRKKVNQPVFNEGKKNMCTNVQNYFVIQASLLKNKPPLIVTGLSVPDHSSGLNDLPENIEDPTTTTTTTFSFLYYYFKQFFKRFQEFKL